eukprot:370640-Rhodomonas_salina.1
MTEQGHEAAVGPASVRASEADVHRPGRTTAVFVGIGVLFSACSVPRAAFSFQQDHACLSTRLRTCGGRVDRTLYPSKKHVTGCEIAVDCRRCLTLGLRTSARQLASVQPCPISDRLCKCSAMLCQAHASKIIEAELFKHNMDTWFCSKRHSNFERLVLSGKASCRQLPSRLKTAAPVHCLAPSLPSS